MHELISKRISITRYLMIIGIVFLHTPPYQTLSELGTSPFELIKAFFSHAVFRATVPMLTVISAYLIFQNLVNTSVKEIIKKKFNSLIIPMVFGNLLVMAPIFIIQYFNLTTHYFSTLLYPFEFMSWINALTGIFSSPANYPLNFLRDLFALCLLIPFFRFLLTYLPYVGAILIIVVYHFNLDGSFILKNSMLISFYFGALVATKRWDITCLDRYAYFLTVFFVLSCFFVVIFDVENRELFRFLAPFMLWPAMSLIVNTKFGNFLYKYSFTSFFTFLAHAPILLALWFLYTSKLSFIYYPVFWFFCPVVTVILCAIFSLTFRECVKRMK